MHWSESYSFMTTPASPRSSRPTSMTLDPMGMWRTLSSSTRSRASASSRSLRDLSASRSALWERASPLSASAADALRSASSTAALSSALTALSACSTAALKFLSQRRRVTMYDTDAPSVKPPRRHMSGA